MDFGLFDNFETFPVEGLRRAPRVLVVDDEAMHRAVLERVLHSDGIEVVAASSGGEALRAAQSESFDLILMDVSMPDLTGTEICRRLKSSPDTWHTPIILVTANSDEDSQIEGYEVGADDFLPKPFNKQLLLVRVRNLLRMSALRSEMENTEAVIFTLASAVEAKDKSTQGHLYRMSKFCEWVAAAIELPVAPRIIRAGAILHDIGKIGIPDAILLKPGKLTDEEYAVMKQHPVIGERICRKLSAADVIGPMVRHHHERWDGAGYPDGLQGEQIPITARIVAIADSFDAMVATRCYHEGMPWEKAFEILRQHAGTQWDPRLIATFLSIMRDRGRADEIRRTNDLADPTIAEAA